ncbi:hypothetical protein NDU88_002579 [Pleurodeles waltl]|uniref:Uncharacterized protein n=1 Tax=Pleurodeles waltl TaxID=8319 RepID=A0AAV7UW09_PLEWA|nr:hypothetical protein NDU88_002579 [Pleurodeles waltl]
MAYWVCSRLSDHPAPEVPESETIPRFHVGDDALPWCQGNADAGNCLGNPDIRVPESIEREDGLCAVSAKEKQDADGDEEEEGTNDRGCAKSNEDILKGNGLPKAGKEAEGHKLRHVPKGTWLTKELIVDKKDRYLVIPKEHTETKAKSERPRRGDGFCTHYFLT